jgi:hypothetical protein
MKIGISLVRTEKGKIIVRGFEPGGIAAKAGFRSGDELVSIGRKTGKQIPLNEPGGIDFRGGQKVRVLRDGALIDLLIPQREKRSAKYRSLNQALGESYANVDQVVREAYSAFKNFVRTPSTPGHDNAGRASPHYRLARAPQKASVQRETFIMINGTGVGSSTRTWRCLVWPGTSQTSSPITTFTPITMANISVRIVRSTRYRGGSSDRAKRF